MSGKQVGPVTVVEHKDRGKEEKKRIFISDLHIYNCLINEINENTRENDDIPDIFKNKYIIFKKLHDDNTEYSTLDDNLQYEIYVQITKEMNCHLTKKILFVYTLEDSQRVKIHYA